LTVVVAGVNQHNKNKHLDVENGEGLGMDDNVLGLVGVEGGRAIHNRLLVGHLGLMLDMENAWQWQPTRPRASAGGKVVAHLQFLT